MAHAAEYAQIASGIYLEGLAVDPLAGTVWYSDVIAGGIHGIAPDGSPVASFDQERRWTGGIAVNHDGCILSSGEGGIRWNNPRSGRSGWILDRLEGQPINGINEFAPDGTGGMFFGTNDIEMVVKGEVTRPTAIYRMTAAGEVSKLADGIGFSNGMAFDPERRRLYCNDTFTCTWAFDVAEDFTLTNRRVFLEKEDADGMALDAAGNVWITGFRSNFLERIAPGGKPLQRVSVPLGSVTQVRFGGSDGRDLYLNSVPADGGDSLKQGVPLSKANSHLYRGRSLSAGMVLPPIRFALND